MKNKHGFLLAEQTLKVVVAVICISFLVYFLLSLYFANLNKEKLQQAEASLKISDESIDIVLKTLGEEGKQVHLKNPSGWSLFNFAEGTKPNLCGGEKCLCICERAWFTAFDGQVKKCDEVGECLVVSNLDVFSEIKIGDDGVFIFVEKVNGLIKITKIK